LQALCGLFVCSIFILLSQESDGGTIFWTKPHPIRSCPFPRFPDVSLTVCLFVYLFACLFVCLFVSSLSSYHEKATVTLHFGGICTRLGVVHFCVFRLFLCLLTTEFAACLKPPSRDNQRALSKDATTCMMKVGVESRSRDCDHTVAIKTALKPFRPCCRHNGFEL